MKNSMAETVVRRRRVLVVEDHDDTRKLILATLRLRNFDTESAADSDTGLEKFNSFKPDLVLLDIMMPGRLDGLDMCRQIRADAGDAVKIAFVTARGQSTDFANGRSAKADA
jgi:DNA-binding response OmpR family regulator